MSEGGKRLDVRSEDQTKAGINLRNAVVVRGMNTDRLTLLSVLVGVALTVAFGPEDMSTPGRVLLGFAVFFGVAVLLRLILRYEKSTHVVMAFAHWVLGREK